MFVVVIVVGMVVVQLLFLLRLHLEEVAAVVVAGPVKCVKNS